MRESLFFLTRIIEWLQNWTTLYYHLFFSVLPFNECLIKIANEETDQDMLAPDCITIHPDFSGDVDLNLAQGMVMVTSGCGC